MPKEIHFETSIETARLMINWLVLHPDAGVAQQMSAFAYFVLEALYEYEIQMADETRTQILCCGCFRLLRVRRDVPGNKNYCPRCGCKMRLPKSAENIEERSKLR